MAILTSDFLVPQIHWSFSRGKTLRERSWIVPKKTKGKYQLTGKLKRGWNMDFWGFEGHFFGVAKKTTLGLRAFKGMKGKPKA